MAKFYAVKSFKKWRDSEKLIGELIRNEVYIKKKTNKKVMQKIWINTTSESIKKMNIQYLENLGEK